MAEAELVLRARGGDELAFRRLLDRHRDLIHFAASKYFGGGLAREDFEQEALWGFHKAVRDYKPGRASNFRSFMRGCVERQVITALKTAKRHKHEVLNLAQHFDAPVSSAEDGLTLAEVVPDSGPGVLQVLEEREELTTLSSVVDGLTLLERDALLGIAQGDTYEQLAAAAGATVKAIDNACQRARRKVAEALANPAPAPAPRPAPPRRRSRTRRRRPCPGSTSPNRIGGKMSIVESVDSEISTVQEEISELEQQLDSKRIRLEGLADLRSRAEALSDPAPTQAQAPRRAKQPKQPQPQVPAKSSTSQGTEDERIDAIVELVGQHPEKGIGAGEIRSSLKLSADQFAALRPRLQSRLRIEGNGRARRYFPEVEAAPRPKPAPARQGRATPAPADSEPRPASAAAEAQYARRGRIAQAIVELVADSEPITGEEIVTMLLEQLPDAERDDVVQTRMRLAREGKIEERAGAYRIPSHQAGPVTQVERDVVACLGSGRTAREVAANVDSVRDAAGARVVLEAMVRRSVLARREGSDPAVYVAVERQALAA